MSASRRLNREAVVAAAAELADSEGWDKLTLAGLATQLEVKTPSLFNHIAGLAALRRELALRGGREMAARISRATIGKAGDEAVFALASTYRNFAKEHPGLYRASVVAPAPGDTEAEAAGAAVVDIILAVLSSYHLSHEDALHAIRGLRSIVHGFVSLEAAGGFGLPLDLDESFNRTVRMLIKGLN